ncbi:MAG: mechanosensitive ion channel [Oscillospiraceae bacterium]|nr:mechanosensitive ion channel [Oscillospiraceae bacterium]
MFNIALLGTTLTAVVTKLLYALLVYIVGKWVIGKIVALFESGKLSEKFDPTLKTFLTSFIRIGLYILLMISIISLLGVPMTSIIAVLASCGLAVGMAMQGSLSNLAGGIMLMIFKPFKAGDFVEAAGVTGVVKEISMFYTVITTLDNKVITVPNGSLMNSNVTNYSAEALRRVDLVFSCAKSEDPKAIEDILKAAIAKDERILTDDAHAPFARLSGGTAQSMDFIVRAWTDNANYWNVYFDLVKNVTEGFGAAGVKAPAYRIIQD